jgi:hypothetical protein
MYLLLGGVLHEWKKGGGTSTAGTGRGAPRKLRGQSRTCHKLVNASSVIQITFNDRLF